MASGEGFGPSNLVNSGGCPKKDVLQYVNMCVILNSVDFNVHVLQKYNIKNINMHIIMDICITASHESLHMHLSTSQTSLYNLEPEAKLQPLDVSASSSILHIVVGSFYH